MRILRKILLGVAGVFGLSAVLTGVLVATSTGQQMLASMAGSIISSPQQRIVLRGLSGAATGTVHLDGIAIADDKGDIALLHDVTINWSPLRLFAGSIAIQVFSVADVELLRLPEAGDARGARAPDLPGWDLQVDRFEVASMSLSRQIAGDPARLSMAGAATLAHEPMLVRLALDVKRIDERQGALTANITFAPQQGQLDVNLSISEPAGGTLAHLLEVPGLPAIDVTATGQGGLADWNARLAVAFDGRDTVTGQANIQAVDDGYRLIGNMAGTPGALLPRALVPFAAGQVELALDMVRKHDASLSIGRAELTSATTRMSAQGAVDFASQRVDLSGAFAFGETDSEIAFTLDDGSSARIGAVRLAIEAKGSTRDAALTLTGSAAMADLAGYSLTRLQIGASSPHADLSSLTIPFAAQAAAQHLGTPSAEANIILRGPLNARIDGTVNAGQVILDKAVLGSAAMQAALAGSVSPFSQTFDLTLKGSLDADTNERLKTIFGPGSAMFSAQAVGAERGDISLTDILVSGGEVDASGQISLKAGTVAARITANHKNLARLHPRITGGISVELTADGARSAPEVVLHAAGDGLALAGKPLTGAVLDFTGIAAPAAPRGRAHLVAKLDGRDVELTGDIVTEEGRTRIDKVRLTAGGALVEGAAQDIFGAQPAGAFSVAIPDLAAFGTLLLRDDLAGSLNGTAEIGSPDGVRSLRVTLTSPALALQDVHVEQGKLDATIRILPDMLAINGAVTAAKIVHGEIMVEQPRLTAASEGSATRFDLRAQVNGAPSAAAGSLRLQDATAYLTLNEASGAYAGIAGKLAAPASVRIVQDTAWIDKLQLAIGGGTIEVSGQAGEVLDLAVKLTSLPASAIDRFADRGLAGAVSGALSVSGSVADPQVSYDLVWSDFSTADLSASAVPALSLTAKGRYAKDQVRLNTNLSGSGVRATVNGTVSIAAAGPSANLAVTGTVPFAVARSALAQAGLRLDGSAAVDLTVSGALSSPNVSGTVSTGDASFVDLGSSITVNNIAGTARLSGKQLRIETLTGTLRPAGKINVSGVIELDPAGGFPAGLTVTMRGGRYIDNTLVAATFDADLTLKGPLAGAPILGGSVAVERADISIPERLTNAVSALGVEHVNAPRKVTQQAELLDDSVGGGSSADGTDGGLALDLSISAPRRVFIRGRGLDAELGGRVDLSGDVSNVRATGGFSLIRGRFDILTKRLTIDRGIITFTGSLDPVIEFSASTSSGGVTATVLISGPASNPRISFSSSPSLPEDEVVAQLLFNKSLTSLSPTQVVQLASAIATLTGAAGDTGILDQLRNKLGFDNLDITTDEKSGGAAVSVGRYLNDRTYVGVKQGIQSGSTSVTTNIDLTDTLKAKGEVDSQGKAKAGLFFEKQY